MKNNHQEINDNEIRVISSDSRYTPPRRRRRLNLIITVIDILAVVGVVALFILHADNSPDSISKPVEQLLPQTTTTEEVEPTITSTVERSYTMAVDTLNLQILYPENARPTLAIGADVLDDSNAVLIVQAADVRSDNGEIAGAFVLNGELMSKGEAKAGFCSIINGALTVGVADATPMLEQALTTGGYFFRQYPLVVGGQIVENKPKGKSIRKALAERDGKICVVISKKRLTFHDFSQALIDAGVRNAIYLVGANSAGFYVDGDGQRTALGANATIPYENTNFLVWR